VPDPGFDASRPHVSRVGEAGVRQLLDIGSGLPTADNVHEIAHVNRLVRPG
jgi:hypothetical protein